MTKRNRPDRGQDEAAHGVPEATRKMVESPADALNDAINQLAEYQCSLQALADPIGDAESSALVGDNLVSALKLVEKYSPGSLKRTVGNLYRGRAEAEALRYHIERYEIESLRPHLPGAVSVEGILWLLAENRRLTLALDKSERARNAANALHAPERDAKKMVLAWWIEHGAGRRMTKDAAADEIVARRLVREKRRTIRGWLTNE